MCGSSTASIESLMMGSWVGRPRMSALARGGQQLAPGAPGADLQQFPAKHVLERFAEQLRFRSDERAAHGTRPPGESRGGREGTRCGRGSIRAVRLGKVGFVRGCHEGLAIV